VPALQGLGALGRLEAVPTGGGKTAGPESTRTGGVKVPEPEDDSCARGGAPRDCALRAPVSAPRAPAPRFLADAMLAGLGRWLRAAGYDTVIAPGHHRDRDILSRAVAEGRLLLTRDRKLLEHREAPGRVILLRASGTEACARELTARLGLDWQQAPFTRCLLCNTPLAPAPEAVRVAVPPEVRRSGSPVRWCPRCRKPYWAGSHVRRMRARLARLAGCLA